MDLRLGKNALREIETYNSSRFSKVSLSKLRICVKDAQVLLNTRSVNTASACPDPAMVPDSDGGRGGGEAEAAMDPGQEGGSMDTDSVEDKADGGMETDSEEDAESGPDLLSDVR